MDASGQEQRRERLEQELSSTTFELNPVIRLLAERLSGSVEGRGKLRRFLESQVDPALNLTVLGEIMDREVIEGIASVLMLEVELDSVRRRERSLIRRLFGEQWSLHRTLCHLLTVPTDTNLFVDWRRMVVQRIVRKPEQ
jgi:hypothetical protein